MFKKPFISIVLALALILNPTLSALANNTIVTNVQTIVQDTIVNYPTIFKAFNLAPDQVASIVMETPSKAIVKIPVQADYKGDVEQYIYGMQLPSSGQYCAWLIFPGSVETTKKACFDVYPGQMSPYQSRLYATSNLAEVGQPVTITVEIKDDNGNPIPNRSVVISSSSGKDKIQSLSGGGVTDKMGQARFSITATEPGTSVINALDIPTGKTLQSRLEMAFRETSPSNVGGNTFSSSLLSAQLLDAGDPVTAGPVDGFEIVGLPSQASPGEFLSFEVQAKDKDGNITPNYTGTIFLSTFDENAVLPDEYTFKASDQGRAVFDLALSFSQPGEWEILALDSNDWDISGNKTITIGASGSSVNPGGSNTNNPTPSTSQNTIQIKAPTNGSAFGSSTVPISFQGPILSNFKVLLDGQEVGQAETDVDGFGTYNLSGLSNGEREVYLISGQTASEPVLFKVDTVPPGIINAKFEPDGPVAPGAAVKVVVVSDDTNLDSATINFQGVEQPLAASTDAAGNYSTTIAAPTQPGNYTVGITLTDSLGNKNVVLDAKTITVQPSAPVTIPQVQGLNGQKMNSAVMLNWKPVSVNGVEIKTYRIDYGTSFSDLNQSIQTPTSPFVVDGLTNGTQYFFSVTAISNQGEESLSPSIILALKPEAEEMETEEPEETDNEEETPPIDIAPPPTNLSPSAGPLIQVSALGSGALLEWSPEILPAYSGQAYFYRVFFGFESGEYIDYVTTKDNQPNVMIDNLIPDLTYFGRIVALDLDKEEISEASEEFTFTTSGGGAVLSGGGSNFDVLADLGGHSSSNNVPFSSLNSAQLNQVPSNTESGNEALWLVLLSLLAGHFFYMHKKKWLRSR